MFIVTVLSPSAIGSEERLHANDRSHACTIWHLSLRRNQLQLTSTIGGENAKEEVSQSWGVYDVTMLKNRATLFWCVNC